MIEANLAEATNEEAVSDAFFELANSPLVGFRVTTEDENQEDQPPLPCEIIVRQNIGTTAHTGGIVWETAYLLLQYLLSSKMKLGRTLEVGAGCGLLGQVLAAASSTTKEVVMTEHDLLIKDLMDNVERNEGLVKSRRSTPVHVHGLDWENYERDTKGACHLQPHAFDTIVGTDVVFTPKLVEPLWQTLQYMSHATTNIYLMLQVRCEASHKLLLEKAASFNFHVDDISNQLETNPSCRWGQALECRLFHVTSKVPAS